MPVYVCKAGGEDGAEPWKHVVQVYAEPFAYSEEKGSTSDTNGDGKGGASSTRTSTAMQSRSALRRLPPQMAASPAAAATGATPQPAASGSGTRPNTTRGVTASESGTGTKTARASAIAVTNTGTPIRRVRHSEILLVDCVFIAFERYWLRLVFPGEAVVTRFGGVPESEYAGCIALQPVKHVPLRQALLKQQLHYSSAIEHGRHTSNNESSSPPRHRDGHGHVHSTVSEEEEHALLHHAIDRMSDHPNNNNVTAEEHIMQHQQHGEADHAEILSSGDAASANSASVSSPSPQQEWLFEIMRADVLLAVLVALRGGGGGSSPSNSNARSPTAQAYARKRRYWLAECTNPLTYNMTSRDEFTHFWRRVQLSVEQELLENGGDGKGNGETTTSATSTTTFASPENYFLGGGGNNDHTMMLCYETGLYFPSSAVLELLPEYDDGLKLKEKYFKAKKLYQQENKTQASTHEHEHQHHSFLGSLSLTSSTRSAMFDHGSSSGEGDAFDSPTSVHEDEDDVEPRPVPSTEQDGGDPAMDMHIGASGAVSDVDEDAELDDDEDDDGPHGDEKLIAVEPVFCRICREGIHDVEFEGGVNPPPLPPPPPPPPISQMQFQAPQRDKLFNRYQV
jgi:hypothetical protein